MHIIIHVHVSATPPLYLSLSLCIICFSRDEKRIWLSILLFSLTALHPHLLPTAGHLQELLRGVNVWVKIRNLRVKVTGTAGANTRG